MNSFLEVVSKNIHDINLLFRTHKKKLGFILKDNESPTRKQESKLFCGYRFLVERNHHQLFYCCCISNDMGDFCICRTKYKKNTITQSQKLLFGILRPKNIFFCFYFFISEKYLNFRAKNKKIPK